jgi:ribosomal protein S18 acetylase RimI-like enzyme
LADESGVIVGHIFAHQRRAPALTIARLYVLPSHQRRGIGERLIEAAIARHPACKVIRLDVEADNEKGLAFYRKQGFAVAGEKIEEGIRHLAMERRLQRG